ncbi:MAG: hypothetical protein IPL46_21235 [Saprospiraceae bacterium]|nr:hypothetical protein [Saprospiraceae bacterium]
MSDAQALFPVASDLCDGDVSDIVKTSGAYVPSVGCAQEGTYTNTWIVTDDCGNTSAVYTQVITITDNTAPGWTTAAEFLDRTVECSEVQGLSDAQALFPVASDLCDGDVSDIVKTSGAHVPSVGCAQEGTYTNTWVVTDDCGNTSAVYTQVITITDNTAPGWTTAAEFLDRTVECSEVQSLSDAQALFPVASDLCDGDVSDIVKTSGAYVPGV